MRVLPNGTYSSKRTNASPPPKKKRDVVAFSSVNCERVAYQVYRYNFQREGLEKSIKIVLSWGLVPLRIAVVLAAPQESQDSYNYHGGEAGMDPHGFYS